MSLINSMLRDLDQRRADALGKDGISRHVRALPPQRKLPWRGLALALFGALAGAFVVWLIMNRQPAPTAQLLPAPAPVPAVVPALSPTAVAYPPAPMPSIEPLHLPVKSEPQPAKKIPLRPIAQGDSQDTGLKLDRMLETGKVPASRASPSARPAASDEGDSRIEKQPRTPVISEAADAEYRKGMNAIKRGAYQEAVAGLGSALRIDARHLLARQALLSLYVDQKLWTEALTIGVEGLAIDPKQTGWAMLVARLQLEKGDSAAALNTLDDHVKYAERNGEYQAFYALLLQKAKKYQESSERYRTALSLKPNEGRWWYGLGLALEGAQRADEARGAFRQARASGNLPADLAETVEQKLHP